MMNSSNGQRGWTVEYERVIECEYRDGSWRHAYGSGVHHVDAQEVHTSEAGALSGLIEQLALQVEKAEVEAAKVALRAQTLRLQIRTLQGELRAAMGRERRVGGVTDSAPPLVRGARGWVQPAGWDAAVEAEFIGLSPPDNAVACRVLLTSDVVYLPPGSTLAAHPFEMSDG